MHTYSIVLIFIHVLCAMLYYGLCLLAMLANTKSKTFYFYLRVIVIIYWKVHIYMFLIEIFLFNKILKRVST